LAAFGSAGFAAPVFALALGLFVTAFFRRVGGLSAAFVAAGFAFVGFRSIASPRRSFAELIKVFGGYEVHGWNPRFVFQLRT
jgi:hypothetical protein